MAKSRTAPKTFLGDQSGGIAIMFAASIVVMVGVVGLSIDGGRAMAAKQKTNAALDAAALAGTRAIMSGKSEADARDYAIEFYHNDLYSPSAYGADYGDPTVDIDMNTKTLRIAVTTKVPTTFGRVLGVKTIDFDSVSEATFNVRDIELGMQLDVTGSMGDPIVGGGSKIDELKSATKELVDTLIPDNHLNRVRIGFAPFAAGVNAGPYVNQVSDGSGPNDCVYERLGADARTDAVPGIGNYFRTKAELPPPPPFPPRLRLQDCPLRSPVLPLTDDKDLLKATVESYSATGSTAGHLGTAWAWYLVSPNWSPIWPAESQPVAYHDGKTIKAAVLMTDGIYNTASGVNLGDYGANAPVSRANARGLCDNMKDDGVIVYTIGFGDDKDFNVETLGLLQDCASIDIQTGGKYFYRAKDASAIHAAFRDIAVKLTNLRLAQ